MSATIDERIVEMKFDDTEFEKGVRSTLKYLDKLREELDLDDAAKGASDAFKTISKAGEQINFDSVEKAIDRINYRFSTMGVIATTALQNITNSVLNLGKSFIGNTISTVFTKGWNRATNIDQAEFTLEGLGLDVKQAMEDADYAVTDTAYGLDEAAKAAAQFAASGVKLGDDMKNALLGVSGMAALTNSDFTSMAEIFTHVAGQGKLMTMQLNQISARGVNAAASLAQYFREGLATEEEMALAIDVYNQTAGLLDLTTESGIREATTKGLISFEIFSHAMTALYGEHAKKANDTYEGAYSNLQAALGRISQPYWTQFRESARDIFNTITPLIKSFKSILDEVGISDSVISSIKWISKGIESLISNIQVIPEVLRVFRKVVYVPFKYVLLTLREIGRVAGEVFSFPGLSDTIEVFNSINEWFLKIWRTYHVTISGIFKGKDYDIAWVKDVKDILGGVFSVINMGAYGLKNIVKLVMPILRLIPEAFKWVIKGGGALGRFLQALNEIVTAGGKFSDFADKVSKINLIDYFSNLGKNSKKFFGSLEKDNKHFKTFKKSMEGVKTVGLAETFKSLREEIGLGGIVSSAFLTVLEKISTFAGSIQQIIFDLKDGLNFKDALGNTNWGSKLIDNVAKFKETFKGGIADMSFDTLKTKFTALTKSMGFGGTLMAGIAVGLQKIGAAFKKAWGWFKNSELFKALAEGLSKLWDAIRGFKYEGSGLQSFFKVVKALGTTVISGLVNGFLALGKGIATVAKFLSGIFAAAIEGFKNSDFITTLKQMGKNTDELGAKLVSVPEKFKSLSGDGPESIKNFFKTTFEGWTFNDWMKVIENGILTALNASLIGTFKDLGSTFKSISGLLDSFKSIIETLKEIANPKVLKGIFSRDSKTTFEHVASAIKDIGKAILEIAIAVAILSIIPEENLNRGVKAMIYISSAVAGLVVVIGLMSKQVNQAKNIASFAAAITAICAGMLMVGIAMAMMSASKNPLAIISSAAALSTVMWSLMGIFFVFTAVWKEVKGVDALTIMSNFETLAQIFQQLAKVMLIIGLSVSMMTISGKAESIKAATVTISVMLWSFMGIFLILRAITKSMSIEEQMTLMNNFQRLVSSFKSLGEAMIGISLAAAVLSAISATTEPGTLAKSIGIIELLLGTMLGMAIIIGNLDLKVSENFHKFGVAMLAISAAMIVISIAVAAMGNLGDERLIKGLTAVTVIFGMLSMLVENSYGVKANTLNSLSVVILSASVMMTALGIMFRVMQGLDTNALMAGIAGISIAFLGIALLMEQADNLMPKDITALSIMLLAAGVAIASIGVMFGVLNGIDMTGAVVGIVAMMTMFGALMALILVSEKMKPEQLVGLGIAIAAMGAAVMMMGIAMAQISDLEHSWKAFGQIALMMAVMVAAILVLDAVGKGSMGTGIIIAAAALAVLSVSLIMVAQAMKMIDGLEHGWKTFGIASLMIAVLTAALLVIAGAGMVIGVGLIEMGIGVKELGLGLLFLVTAATAFCAIVDVWGGSMDVLAGEILVFLETIAAGIGSVGVTFTTSLHLIFKNIWNNIVSMAGDIAEGIMLMIDAVMNALVAYGPELTGKFLEWVKGTLFTIASAIRGDNGLVMAAGDLSNSIMTIVFGALSNWASGNKVAQFFGLDEVFGNAAQTYKDASKDFIDAENKYLDEQEEVQNKQETLNGEASGLFDGLGDGGLASVFSKVDFTSFIGDSLGDIDIQKMDSGNIADQITKLFPDDTAFSQLGSDGAEGWISGWKEANPDGDLQSMLVDMGDAMNLSDEAEDTGKKTGSGMRKTLRKELKSMAKETKDSSTFAKDAMAKLREEFGDDSEEMARLMDKGGWAYLQELGTNVQNESMTAKEAIADLNDTISNMSDDEIAVAEEENKEVYDKYYERGQSALEGYKDGFNDKETRDKLDDVAYRVARDMAAGVTDTLSMGNWNKPVASGKMKTIGQNAIQGLIDGLKDETLRANLTKAAKSLGNMVTEGTKSKDGLDEASPSKKMMKIGIYAGQGLIIGVEKTNKGIKKSAKKVAQSFLKELSLAGINKTTKISKKSLASWSKTFNKELKNIEKHLKKAKTDKAIRKWTKKLEKEFKRIDKIRKKALGLSKGKLGTAQIRLWESSDDYSELKTQLKDYEKEYKKAIKNVNKYTTKNDIKGNTASKKELKALQAEQKKLEKSSKKSDKQRAKKLSKYIKQIKDAKKNIKNVHKEIKQGYKKYWKQYWKELKENANDTFRQIFVSEARKTFEVFGAEMSSTVDVLNASLDNSLDIISSGASEATNSVQILSDTFDRLTDVMAAAYDTSIDLFNEFQTTWYNPTELLQDMHDNLNGYQTWLDGLKELSSRNGTEDLVRYIEDMGFSADALSQLMAFNKMSDSMLADAVSSLEQKSRYETQMYLANMEKEVSTYNEWKKDLQELADKGVSQGVLDRLKEMGVDGIDYVRKFMGMTEDEIAQAEYWFEQEAKIASDAYFENIEDQLSKWNKWQSNLGKLAGMGFSEEFIKQVKGMGVSASDYVEQLILMDSDKVSRLNKALGEQQKAEAASMLNNMQDALVDYSNYSEDVLKIAESNYSDSLKEYLYSLGYEGYETLKQFTSLLDDPTLVDKANSLYEAQMKVNAEQFYGAMADEQSKYAKWIQNLDYLESQGLDRGMLKELMAAGVDDAEKVAAIVTLAREGEIDKVNELYSNQYKLNANSLTNSMKSNLSDWQEYYQGVASIMDKTATNGIKLDSSIIEKIKEMGVDGLEYIREIASMSTDEIKNLNKMAKAEQALTRQNVLIDIKAEKEKMIQFGKDLEAMAKLGFSPEVIQELVDAGYDAASDIASVYATMGKQDVAEINTLYKNGANAMIKAQKLAYEDAAEEGTVLYTDSIRSQQKLYEQTGEMIPTYLKNGIVAGNAYVEEAAKLQGAVITAGSVEWLKAYGEDLSSKMNNAGVEGVKSTTEGLQDETATGELLQAMSELATDASTAYINSLKELYAKVQRQIIRTCRPTTGTGNTRDKIKTGFKNLAAQCATGFANVLKSSDSVKKVQNAAYYMAKGALTAAKKALGINSPSKEFGYLADYSIEGYVNSMQAGTATAGAAGKSMADAVLDQAASVVTGLQTLGEQSELGFGIEPIFDSDSTVRGLAAIEDMVQAKNMAVQTLSFDNLSDINTLTTLNDSLNNLTTAISGMESYAERLDNIETLLGTYLPDATTDIYLDGDKVSSYVENTITNNLVRRRAGW